MVTPRIKIDNLDLIWKIHVVMLTKLQETKPVVFLVFSMVMVENKFLNIALRLSQLNSEKKFKRNQKIYMLFTKEYFKKLTVN
jgi:hypothetical protein